MASARGRGRPRKFCSDRCRAASYRATHPKAPVEPQSRHCRACGGWITDLGRGRPKLYCSDVCRRRHWDHEHRNTCMDCETVLGPGSARRGTTRCWSCEVAKRNRSTHGRADQIAAKWAEGLPMSQIAADLGMTVSNLGATIFRIRASQPDALPYRRPCEATR